MSGEFHVHCCFARAVTKISPRRRRFAPPLSDRSLDRRWERRGLMAIMKAPHVRPRPVHLAPAVLLFMDSLTNLDIFGVKIPASVGRYENTRQRDKIASRYIASVHRADVVIRLSAQL